MYSLSDLFEFNPDGSYHPQSPFSAPDGNQGFDPNVYQQNDQGQPVAWAPAEATRRSLIDKAYNNSLNPQSSAATNFNTRFQPPSQLGTDVFNSLAQSGLWMPDGVDISGKQQPIQARVDPNSGNIIVSDPRGGDANTSMYTYDPSGKFVSQTIGHKGMSPLQGLLAVAGAATGFGALGTLAAGGSIGLSGAASAAGLIPKQILPDIIGGMPSSTFSRGTNMGFFDQLGSSQAQQSAQAGKTPEEWAQMLASGGGGVTPPNPFVTGQGQAQGGGGILDSLSSLFGGGGGTSSASGLGGLSGLIGQLGGLGNIGAQLIPGLVGANQQSNAGQSMIDFLNNQQNTMQQQGQTAQKGLMDFINGQQSKIDGLYNPGTPEANALQQQMEAKDAAAGRNSQYGTRSVDLAAKLAGLKGGLDAQFAGSAIPAVNSSLNQTANNTNTFTQGTSRALADALGVRSNAFNSLLSGLGALNQKSQTPSIPGGVGQAVGQAAGALGGANFGGLSNLFNNTFGGGFSGGSDSLTGLGVDGSVPFGSGFNFSNPILDSNGIGSIGSAGGTGIDFGNFGSGLDAFSGSSAFGSLPDVSDALDWFL